MASTSQAHAAFPSRGAGAGAYAPPSGKLPDRTVGNNPPPFGSSVLARGQGVQQQQGGYAPHRGGPSGAQQQQQERPEQQAGQGRAGLEKDVNALDEIQEDQREEINEAVSACTVCFLRI